MCAHPHLQVDEALGKEPVTPVALMIVVFIYSGI